MIDDLLSSPFRLLIAFNPGSCFSLSLLPSFILLSSLLMALWISLSITSPCPRLLSSLLYAAKRLFTVGVGCHFRDTPHVRHLERCLHSMAAYDRRIYMIGMSDDRQYTYFWRCMHCFLG
ncbi:uncharacterized protein BJX67DRAFT_46003 [Aspergillus lucknowensis]|uniref:Uncharacterized protein n=1 Tax=Aspergillus lucknowensis TaxID=176173 RepID=A0ABR4LW29_9EURO